MGVEQVARHPSAIRNTFRIEFARRHHYLLRTTVDFIAVYVKISNGIERRATFIKNEAIAHLNWVELTNITQRAGIIVQICRGNRLQIYHTARDISKAESLFGCSDIAIDERQLPRAHVGLHDEPLHHGWIHTAGSHRNDDPQHSRQHRQAPPALTKVSQEQHCNRQRNQNHKLRRRKLGIDIRIRRTLHDTSRRAREVVARIPIVEGSHKRQHCKQHAEVQLCEWGDLASLNLQTNPTV